MPKEISKGLEEKAGNIRLSRLYSLLWKKQKRPVQAKMENSPEEIPG
jgi:hypothetical protein